MVMMKRKTRTVVHLLVPQVLHLLALLRSHLPLELPLGSPLEHLRALLSALLPLALRLPVVLWVLTHSAPTHSVRTPSDPIPSALTRLAPTPSALALVLLLPVLLPLELLLEASPPARPLPLPALPLQPPSEVPLPPLLLRTKRCWGSLQRVKDESCKQYNRYFPLLF